MKISLVVAVYHNEGAISKTHEKILSVFANELTEYSYEIIFVDDGSKDGSLAEILNLKEQDSRIKAITFTRNFGQMAVMLAGFKEATGDAVINISADLQDPVKLIPQMIEKWQGVLRSSFAIGRIAQTPPQPCIYSETIKFGKPPALPGDSHRFDLYGGRCGRRRSANFIPSPGGEWGCGFERFLES